MNYKDFGIGEGEIKYKYMIREDDGTWHNCPNLAYFNNGELKKVENEYYLRFTGIKDKSGLTEVCEGDIVDLTFDTYLSNTTTERVVITSMDGALTLEGKRWDDRMPYYEGGTNYNWRLCETHEIIGNVFNTPGLLILTPKK